MAAARALRGVEEGGFAEDLLGEADIHDGHRRLAWFLVFGALRHRGELDAALDVHLRQPIESLDAQVRAALRLGAFEKFHGRSPDRAVVQQWVEVAKRTGAGRAHGLVNAVMRRVEHVVKPELNHPAWLLERWKSRYGVEAADAWCVSNQTAERLCVVSASTLDLEPVEGLEQAWWAEEHQEGTWVMDPAAVQVADRFAAAVGEGRVLDACAAPGGKALRLWWRGLDVVATDRRRRLPRLQENIDTLGAKIEVRRRDWTKHTPSETFDGILVDAPCTGLGTLRRHPEIRWRRTPDDFEEMSARQLELLVGVQSGVRPGGVLGYAVCSTEPEEGLQVIERFLESTPGFTVESEWTSAPPPPDVDGHQLFLLRRTEA